LNQRKTKQCWYSKEKTKASFTSLDLALPGDWRLARNNRNTKTQYTDLNTAVCPFCAKHCKYLKIKSCLHQVFAFTIILQKTILISRAICKATPSTISRLSHFTLPPKSTDQSLVLENCTHQNCRLEKYSSLKANAAPMRSLNSNSFRKFHSISQTLATT